MSAPIGYVVQTFPLVSETFVENEVRAVCELGRDVVLASLQHPMPGREAPTVLSDDDRFYRPARGARIAAVVRWSMRRPGAMTGNVWDAVRNRSETMLRASVDAAWIASAFRRRRVQHVHGHFATEGAAVAMATSRLLGVPFTFTAHAVDIYKRTGGLCTKSARAARVVTVCEYNIDQLMARCPTLRREHISLVYCGVDTDAFTMRAAVPSGRPFRVLSVGRLVPKKGFDDLIRAVALTREHADVRLDIIGEGHQRPPLEALIDELGVGDAVRLLGLQSNERVRDALAGTDVFALACVVDPTEDRDSMPVVIKEAMAVGVPVVATDEVGNPEMVDDAVGRLVPPRDPPALAAALLALAALSPEERALLGTAARARAVERFDLRGEAAKLLGVFDDAAGSVRPGRRRATPRSAV
jgi:glycosyltransferase involved in cell wall biosynthesis